MALNSRFYYFFLQKAKISGAPSAQLLFLISIFGPLFLNNYCDGPRSDSLEDMPSFRPPWPGNVALLGKGVLVVVIEQENFR